MVRIQFSDGNEIGIAGNEHFVARVLSYLRPVMDAYVRVGELNTAPVNQARMDTELEIVKEHFERQEPFTGKYISFIPDEQSAAIWEAMRQADVQKKIESLQSVPPASNQPPATTGR